MTSSLAYLTAPKNKMRVKHKPVLLNQVINIVAKKFKNKTSNLRLVDCTLGDGGHSVAMYTQLHPKLLVSLDWDLTSIRFVKRYYNKLISGVLEFDNVAKTFMQLKDKKAEVLDGKVRQGWYVVHANFANIKNILRSLEIDSIDVVLWDLGLSSRQLESKGRGFSFNDKSVLDLRISPATNDVPAYKLLNILSQKELVRLFTENVGMPVNLAVRLSKELVIERQAKPFGNKDDMARIKHIAYKVKPLRRSSIGHLHPATLVLLALRMAVNFELSNLIDSLEGGLEFLTEQGILLVITFHSAEESVVNDWITKNSLVVEVITPSKLELAVNPRARSAKLFVVQKK